MKDRYQIQSTIGTGGHGVIYEAMDLQMQRKVAIKRINLHGTAAVSEGEKSLKREMETLAALNHPNIVRVFDADEDENGLYLVMELLTGKSLLEFVEEHQPVSQEDFLEFAVQALDALSAAKKVDILHRDIKSSNFILERTPAGRLHVTLLDFGLAKFCKTKSTQTRTMDDMVMGSVHFMAPEQFEILPLDHRTDLYSFGVCCYYMLTGLFPFDGKTAAQVMAAHLQHQIVPLHQRRPDLPMPIVKCVYGLEARSPEDRPASALEALVSLREAGNPDASGPLPLPVVASRVDKPKKNPEPAGKRLRNVVTAFGVAALLGAGAFLVLNANWILGSLNSAPVSLEATELAEAMDQSSKSLPSLGAWTREITEPGAEIVEVLESDQESTVEIRDGIGAEGHPRLFLTMDPQPFESLTWAFHFRLAEASGDDAASGESWVAQLGGLTPDQPLLARIAIHGDRVEIRTGDLPHQIPCTPGRWYRLELTLDGTTGVQRGSLSLLDADQDQQAWAELSSIAGPVPLQSLCFRDGTENTFKPNMPLQIANVTLDLEPKQD